MFIQSVQLHSENRLKFCFAQRKEPFAFYADIVQEWSRTTIELLDMLPLFSQILLFKCPYIVYSLEKGAGKLLRSAFVNYVYNRE